jgi:hypothetical protein
MGNSTLDKIRERLNATENNKKTFDNAFFPFWNAKTDTTSVVRFVPDGNSKNDFFWAEKLQIKLPFNGIKGGDTKPVTVSVPCVEMFGKEEYPQGCPILSEVRAWYKDESLKEKANRYWKKPTYIMQGFVRENLVADDVPPENPIRKFSLNKQVFNLVKAGLMDAEMKNSPCDFEAGTDFKITKTQKGQYFDYGTSKYARAESSLTQSERDAIEKFGLSNLSDFLGKKPTEEELKIIREMFEASVNGEAYDTEKWGKFYKPSNLKNDKESDGDTKAPETEKTVTHVAEKKSEKHDESVTTSSEKPNTSASQILEMIKNRGKKTESK